MYWLVLYIASGYPAASAAIVVLPEKYQSHEACKTAARSWQMKMQSYECVPAPEQIATTVPQYDKEGRLKVYIDNMPKCVTNINSGKLECN